MKMKKKTHYNQMITAKTRKLLEKLCKRTKLSKPMQLEIIVEKEHINSLNRSPSLLSSYSDFPNKDAV
jgi:hypothetical protein|tara:strand:+ start:223 stop:426 length:204 start_codon:yes stop_codon:yes gene_type:complete